MSAQLETKSSSATLVDPPSVHDEVPPLPERAAGHILSPVSEGSAVGNVSSPMSASFDPNGATPGQISSLPTPPTLSHGAPATDLLTPSPVRPPDSHPQASPLSASFDPNPGHLPAIRNALRSRLSASSLGTSDGSIHVAQEQWNHIMSTSLNALASQFQAASLAIGSDTTFGSQHGRDESSASYRTSVSGDHDDSVSELALARAGVNPQGVETMLSLMMSRLENLERNQARLGGELEHVREELKSLKKGPADGLVTPVEKGISGYFDGHPGEKAKMKGKEVIIESNDVERKDQEEWQKRVEALETKVESIFETLKLEQARLYPRLQNAFVTLNKHPIKPLPVQGSGKAPANFPATKGEFEHLTKERYEQIMKAYSIPVKGDTAAKREAVREFIGLTPPGK